MKSPTLSVCIPNYNHARFLPEALDAILSQSYQPLEIIVIDDASTDDSMEVLEEYARKSPLVRVIRNERNMGVIANMNRMLELSRGGYWYGAAADDRVLPGFLESSMSMLAQHPTAGLCTTMSRIIDEEGRDAGVIPGDPVLGNEPRFIPPQDVLRHFLLYGSRGRGNTTIWRRDALIAAGGFRPELGSYCDSFVQDVLALRHGFCYIPRPLAAWRRMPTTYSLSSSSNPVSAMAIYNAAVQLMQTEYGDVFTEEYVRRWQGRFVFVILQAFIGRLNDDFTNGVELMLAERGRMGNALRFSSKAFMRMTSALLVLGAGVLLRPHDTLSWLRTRLGR